MDYSIIKYPRTPHIEGSRLQVGDEDLTQIPFDYLLGRHVVVEEKIDGANTAVSFDNSANLLLQSRGHFLTGGYRERHYNLFKKWAYAQMNTLWEVLGSRYIMYGEWMYAKHTIYYDMLPHYFMEFDILDRESGKFIDTDLRHKLIAPLPVVSVPVLKEGYLHSKEELLSFLGKSSYISDDHIKHLRAAAVKEGENEDQVLSETDSSDLMEGLYIKVEEDGEVKERMKYVRRGFLQCVDNSGSHWLDRTIIPNGLSCDIDSLFI